MDSVPVYPVAAFRESATAFQAALTACVEEPKVKSVHMLRTSTRRLESLLEFLQLLKGLPKHKRLSKKLAARLKKLRRRAGALRDVDVSQKLLDKRLPPDALYSGQINQASGQLNRELARRRQREAENLTEFLQKKHRKVSKSLADLLHALEGADDFALPLADLVRFIDTRYQADHSVGMRDPSAEQLHGIRKAAKAARYAAEISKEPAAGVATERYGKLQQAGGEWHDWHMLSTLATQELGEDHPIAGAFAHLCERELNAFRAQLLYDRQSQEA